MFITLESVIEFLNHQLASPKDDIDQMMLELELAKAYEMLTKLSPYHLHNIWEE